MNIPTQGVPSGDSMEFNTLDEPIKETFVSDWLLIFLYNDVGNIIIIMFFYLLLLYCRPFIYRNIVYRYSI